MRSENLISIVIPVFNDWDDLKELFNGLSLKNNSYSIEIIVVDSSHEIKAKDVIKTFIKNNEEINYKYISHDPSYAGKSMNLGIESAQGDYIAFLDTKTKPVGEWPYNYVELIKSRKMDVVLGSTKYEAKTKFQKILKAASYGQISHETVPGSVIRRDKLQEISLFRENLRASYDLVWRNEVKEKLNWYKPIFQSIRYSSLPKNLLETVKKYFIYSLHTAYSDVQLSVKQTYLSLILILSLFLVPRWNYFLTGWDTHPLYIADITKIFLFSILFLLFITLLINRLTQRIGGSQILINSLKFITFLLISYSVYKWNAVIANWIESAVLYIPHVTKIYLGSLILASIVYRGFLLPIKREEPYSFLFPYRWIKIGLLGLLLDLIKLPGYTLGAFISLFRESINFKDKSGSL